MVLGVEMSCNRDMGMLTVWQSRYTQKRMEQSGLEWAKRPTTPMDDNVRPTQDSEPSLEPYHEAIGSIMYLMVGICPDLAFHVCTLAKFVESPTENYRMTMQSGLKIILRSQRLGLRHGGPREALVLIANVDADWAGDISTRKSMIGGLVMMDGATVF